MRIVIDMQGAQTDFSKHRGVGRYTREMARAMLAACPADSQVMLAMNGAFPASVTELREEFDVLAGYDNIKVWQQFFDTTAADRRNSARMRAGELLREEFLNSLAPDVIFSTNLQEGIFEPAVTGVKGIPSSAFYCSTLHDLTPLMYKEKYLVGETNARWYYEKLDHAKNSDLVVTVSEFSRKKIHELLGVPLDKICVTPNSIDRTLFRPVEVSEEERAQLFRKYSIRSKYLMYAGGADAHKNLARLYEAYSLLPEELRSEYQLLMVGKELKSEEAAQRSLMSSYGIGDHVIFTGFVPDEDIVCLYHLCGLFVFPSISEGFGIPPLEAISCGAPTISSNATSLPEVIGVPEALFDPLDVQDMAGKMQAMLTNETLRQDVRQREMAHAERFSWENSARTLWEALRESLSSRGAIGKRPQQTHLQSFKSNLEAAGIAKELTDKDYESIAISYVESLPEGEPREPRIFLDVSATIVQDDRSGIQRVVRAIGSEFMHMDLPKGYTADIVYTRTDNLEFYRGNKLRAEMLGESLPEGPDEWIDMQAGDILLMLDLHPGVARTHIHKTRYLIDRGVRVYHVVYDLLPVSHPKFFNRDICEDFKAWLLVVLQSCGVICISRAVAQEVVDFMDAQGIRPHDFRVGWFHLGADVEKSLPSKGIPPESETVFRAMKERRSFLMVGTLEPRKGHRQILSVMEQLWQSGKLDWNLVIVGRQGWEMEEFAAYLREHPEAGKRLFWLQGISDEYLERIYHVSDCLIAASEGEGFGLPLIEAAQFGIPILARDIPVFHEVAGEHAYYFDGADDAQAAQAILAWVGLYEKKEHPVSEGLPFLTWRGSAEQLAEVIFQDNWWRYIRA